MMRMIAQMFTDISSGWVLFGPETYLALVFGVVYWLKGAPKAPMIVGRGFEAWSGAIGGH